MNPLKTYSFGAHSIRQSEIFFASRLSFGLVNLKPLVPGHVLVISKRVVPRFRDLTPEEVTDMALSVQKIARVIEREYQGESMTIAMQDGPLAGQTVPHCHFHLIPRRRNDWPNNDDIYRDLERHSKEYIIEDHERKPRTLEEMAEEAARLRKFFPEDCLFDD